MKSGAGSRRKLHAGASCKLLLAYAPPAVKHALLNSELLRYSKNTITQRSKLTQELSKIISEGYASSDGEITPDVMAIAVPIFDAQNEVVAALSLAGTKLRFEEQHAHYLQRLNHYADLLSSALKTVA